MKSSLLWLVLGASVALPALAEAPEVMNGRLVDEHKMTLYTFAKDTAGKSNCDAVCASKWPPAIADSYDKASGNWSLVKRDDGKQQWAYKGQPLYRWVMDKKPGDAGGEGMGGVWHAAKP
jgi:predicted lipoprotein with Yx(FWY)xxD motif